MNVFFEDDKVSCLKDIEFGVFVVLMQCSLGLYWNLQSDLFIYYMFVGEKLFSKQGILFVVNSFYDFLGFIVLVVILSKLFLWDLMVSMKSWDELFIEYV